MLLRSLFAIACFAALALMLGCGPSEGPAPVQEEPVVVTGDEAVEAVEDGRVENVGFDPAPLTELLDGVQLRSDPPPWRDLAFAGDAQRNQICLADVPGPAVECDPLSYWPQSTRW